MRFVRLARHFGEQNMLLEQGDDQRLYFRSCQLITARQELKVGYSQTYAQRYGLCFLEPIMSDVHPTIRWPCFECTNTFETFEILQIHLDEHEVAKQNVAKDRKEAAATFGRKKRRANHRRLTTRKVSGPTVRYACCFCSQVFSTLVAFKKHNEAEHDRMECGSRVGIGANPASVLHKRKKKHKPTLNRCHQCRRSFPSAERFEVNEVVFYKWMKK